MPVPATCTPSPLRQLMLVLLVLAMVCSPVLSFTAEAHEALAHPAMAADDGAHGHEDATGGAAGDESASPLHLAMHVAGCCGHACATLPAVSMRGSATPPALAPGHVGTLAPDAHLDRKLRPPITG